MKNQIDAFRRHFAFLVSLASLGLAVGFTWSLGGCVALLAIPLLVCPLDVWRRGDMATCTLDVPNVWPIPLDTAGRKKWRRYWSEMLVVTIFAIVTRLWVLLCYQ